MKIILSVFIIQPIRICNPNVRGWGDFKFPGLETSGTTSGLQIRRSVLSDKMNKI